MSVVGYARKKPAPDANAQPEDGDGRPPPHDLGAERALLSCVMVDPEALDLVAGLVRPEHFYSEGHRQIFLAAVGCRAEGRPCDSVNVCSWLSERDRLQQVGDGSRSGMAAVAAMLLEGAPRNVESYARIVRDRWRVRQALAICREHAARAYLDHGTADEYLGKLEHDVLAMAAAHEGGKVEEFGAVLERAWKRAHEDQEFGRYPGLPIGFADYDALSLGNHSKDLEIIGARPGMGKTSFGLCVALNLARRVPELIGEEAAYCGVLFFSCEMPKEQIGERLLSIESRVPFTAIRARNLTAENWRAMGAAAARLHSLPIRIDDTPGIDIQQLRARVRRTKSVMAQTGYRKGHPTKLREVVVDYLQLIKAKHETVRSREQEVALVARELKEIAKDEDVNVIALAQLNRAVEGRSGAARRPTIADLRESGEIENAADKIVFLYREDYYRDSTPAPGDEGKTELILAKHRNGPTGTAFVRFRKACTAFENM